MNTNLPGMSVFQGAESLKVNSTLERQEEEEMMQDQKRREAELGNLLENAFNDLDDDDDDDSNVDSTTNFQTDILPHSLSRLSSQEKPYPQMQPQQHLVHQQQNNWEQEIHKLKMLVESKNHELKHLANMAKEADKKCDDCEKRLIISQAELERALRNNQQTHELLVESKERCSNLDNTIEKLRSEKKELETENTGLVGQLQTAQMMLSDVQRKYDLVERDYHKREDRQADIRIKQLEEHQRAQIDLMQQQMNQVSDQLDKKKQELEQLHSKYNALQTSQENMLIDKAAKINELSNALDVAQRRCNQLSARPNYEAEYTRQQQCIADLHAQIGTMEKTITTLNERVNGTTAELDLMDTLLQQHHSEDTPGRMSQMQSRFVGSTPLSTADRMGRIKQELYRALGNVKQKREEVLKLEKQLEDRQGELRQLRENENKYLVDFATMKEDKTKLENRIKVLQQELDEAQTNSLNDSRQNKLQSELNALIGERDALKQTCATQASELNYAEDQLQNVQVDLEELKQEHESLKQNYEQLLNEQAQLRARFTADNVRLDLERHKILLKDAQSEVERLKKLYADIANDKETLNYQLTKLRETDSIKELQSMRDQLAGVQRTLQLAELKSTELAKILDAQKLSHERELQALREKSEREKQNELKAAVKEGVSNCTKCMDYIAEITKGEIQMLKINNLNSLQRKELDDLNEQLKKAKAVQAEAEEKLNLVDQQDRLITELKAKAVQFEEYIKVHTSNSNSLTSPRHSASPKQNEKLEIGAGDAPVSSAEVTQTRIKRIEQRVRDEMGKLFTAEMKRFNIRLQQNEEKSLCLQREYQVVCNDLQQRQTEVDLLKQTILAEREKIEEILSEKDQTYLAALEKQKQLLQKSRHELQAKNERIENLMHELDERHATIESERQSMKVVMTQWEEQRRSIDQVEEEWRKKLQSLRETHEEAMHASQVRYQSAKRTALNYKIYAEDKEAHMKREYERIKQEYEMSLAKIEATMNQRLEFKRRELAKSQETQTPATINKGVLTEQQVQASKPQRDKENKSKKK